MGGSFCSKGRIQFIYLNQKPKVCRFILDIKNIEVDLFRYLCVKFYRRG